MWVSNDFTFSGNRSPFQLNFRSDKWETAPEVAINNAITGQTRNNGFMLVYFMDAQFCNSAAIAPG